MYVTSCGTDQGRAFQPAANPITLTFPDLLATHPHYERLQKAGALFKDPFRGNIAVTTPIWSAGVGESEKGSWADMTHPEGRAWWAEGVESLVSLGCDAMWK
jgi:alpha-glucosidase (family GH31 glycosyl hydrolase)